MDDMNGHSKATATMLNVDVMLAEIVDVMMAHPLPSGAADYGRVSAAFVAILAEMMAPQPAEVCQRMQDDFAKELRQAIRVARGPKIMTVVTQ